MNKYQQSRIDTALQQLDRIEAELAYLQSLVAQAKQTISEEVYGKRQIRTGAVNR